MAVTSEYKSVETFDDWYDRRTVDDRNGGYREITLAKCAARITQMYDKFKREMEQRTKLFPDLEKLTDGEVITIHDDLPNVSSGETAGLVRRTARALVQNTPNVDIVSEFDDDSIKGAFVRYILTSRILKSDTYTNDMQQHLFASVKTSLTLGFACVVPVLIQDAKRAWTVKYDPIHYADVFPEPGARDVRDANIVFIRRYLSKADVHALIRMQPEGWDIDALKTLMKTDPPARKAESTSHQDAKYGIHPDGYEIITMYTNDGEDFITFDARTKMLLRLEENRHPLNQHPVFFLVLEKDDQQPLGKSQVEMLVGRQEFQDLLLNGAMKMWYRDLNPPIIGYGAINAVPNLSPGAFNPISNPNAKLEAFTTNSQTLLQHGTISQQNLGSMVNMLGTPDQQMAATAGNGMSATPQGVESQQAVVDTTISNYQKAIEAFLSDYASYSLTTYFAELESQEDVRPSADARQAMLGYGLPAEAIGEDGILRVKFKDLATQYWVKIVPGSLVEMEDEKQARILQGILVPLSQAMPAIAASQDQAAITNASTAIQFIFTKLIELSGSKYTKDLKTLTESGPSAMFTQLQQKQQIVEDGVNNVNNLVLDNIQAQDERMDKMQNQMDQQTQAMSLLLNKLGVDANANQAQEPAPAQY